MIDNTLDLTILHLIPFNYNLQFLVAYKKKEDFNETEKIPFAVVQTQLREPIKWSSLLRNCHLMTGTILILCGKIHLEKHLWENLIIASSHARCVISCLTELV